MPNISELKQSKFLKKDDCVAGILVTIRGCEQHNVAAEGAPEESKWCLSFDEVEKPMVLNITNGQIIAKVCGSENTDDWVGHKIVLYHDPAVSYGGKLIGGIRARAPKNQPAKPKAPAIKPGTKPSAPCNDSGEVVDAPAEDAIPF